jgi:hypothetical protein
MAAGALNTSSIRVAVGIHSGCLLISKLLRPIFSHYLGPILFLPDYLGSILAATDNDLCADG